MRHSGEYTCVATNSVGTASCRARLTLKGRSFVRSSNIYIFLLAAWETRARSVLVQYHIVQYQCFHFKVCCMFQLFPIIELLEPRYPPVFDKKLSTVVDVSVGDSVELECHMTGSLPLKVTWSKDHKDIRSGGNYKMSCVDNSPHLTILKADKSNYGRYFCHATNDIGKDSCSTEITVKGIWPTGTQFLSLRDILVSWETFLV